MAGCETEWSSERIRGQYDTHRSRDAKAGSNEGEESNEGNAGEEEDLSNDG